MIRFALSVHHSGMSCSLEEHIGIGRQGRVEISGILWPQVHTGWQNERLHRSMYIYKYIFACKIIIQKKKKNWSWSDIWDKPPIVPIHVPRKWIINQYRMRGARIRSQLFVFGARVWLFSILDYASRSKRDCNLNYRRKVGLAAVATRWLREFVLASIREDWMGN